MTNSLRGRIATFILAAAGLSLGLSVFAPAPAADAASLAKPTPSCVNGFGQFDVAVGAETDIHFVKSVRTVLSGPNGYADSKSANAPVVGQTPDGFPLYADGIWATISFTHLAPGDYVWDFYDTTGSSDGDVEHGPHSTGAEKWRDPSYWRFTIPASCVPPTTTATATTAAPTTAAPPTTAVVGDTTLVPGATTTTVLVGEPTTAVTVATTAVVQSTIPGTPATLPATGSNSTPLVIAGVAFLGLGAIAVLYARRERPAY